MKKLNVENIFFYSVAAFIALIHVYAYRVWLFSSGILSQGDWMLSLPNYSKQLLSLPVIWKSYSIGSIDLTPPFYLFMLLEGILSNLGIGYGYIERITFMWPIAILTIPLTYLFIKSIVQNRVAALVGAIIYAYNTYFLIIQTGHLTLMVGFALAPLVLYLFSLTLDKKSFFYAILAGLSAFIISIYEFRAFYLVTIIALFYYLYYLFAIADKKLITTLRKTVAYAISPVVIVVLLNIYWILPYMFATVAFDGTVFSRELFGKEFFNISKASTLFHPYWTGDKYFPFITQPIPHHFFLLPILAFLGLYVGRKNKKIVFYGIVSLLGVFLTKQNNAPFPDVYTWLYGHFPGFGAFREASKFYFIVALGYSVLIGAFVDWMWRNWKTGYLYKLKYLVVLIIVGLSVWNLKPLVMGTYGTLFEDRTMPHEYISLNNYIDSQNEFFRTLWIPVDSRWGTNTDLHPKVGAANMASGIWKDFAVQKEYASLGAQFIDFYNTDNKNMLLNTTSVKYVIVPKVDKENEDNFYDLFGKERNDYIANLDKAKYLKRQDLSLNTITIYENMNYKPHIYITDEKESIEKNITFRTVQYEHITNAEYRINLKNLSKPIYIHFTDSYHPDWRIRLGDFQWTELLFNHNYFIPNDFHSKNEAKLNSYYIDPDYVKKNLKKDQYSVNSDGSLDAVITLYFVPQTYTYIGFAISSLVFLALLSYLLFTILKKHEK